MNVSSVSMHVRQCKRRRVAIELCVAGALSRQYKVLSLNDCYRCDVSFVGHE